MPITTLVFVYATSQVSNYVYASYVSAGVLVSLSAVLSAVHFSSQGSSINKESEMSSVQAESETIFQKPKGFNPSENTAFEPHIRKNIF